MKREPDKLWNYGTKKIRAWGPSFFKAHLLLLARVMYKNQDPFLVWPRQRSNHVKYGRVQTSWHFRGWTPGVISTYWYFLVFPPWENARDHQTPRPHGLMVFGPIEQHQRSISLCFQAWDDGTHRLQAFAGDAAGLSFQPRSEKGRKSPCVENSLRSTTSRRGGLFRTRAMEASWTLFLRETVA